MVLPSLLLQKPSQNSKAKDHCRKLEERLLLWKEGQMLDLLKEGRLIQERLKSSKSRILKDIGKNFAKLMMKGKVNAALKMLTDSHIGVHQINEEIFSALREKHPHHHL